MPIRLERGNPTTVSRNTLKSGQVFRGVQAGSLYAHIGYLNDGGAVSLNLSNGQIGETRNLTRAVELVGNMKLVLTRRFNTVTHAYRSAVRQGQVFKVASESAKRTYVAIGRLADGRYAAQNVATGDVVISNKGDKRVEIIGETDFVGQVTS